MNEAQKIADAVLASVEGEDLLIEAMARALCQLYGGEDWQSWRPQAHAKLVCDRVLRGPGDKAAYERIVAQAKEREL